MTSETNALRLVLDQGVPRDAAILLRALGLECTHVSEMAMAKAADAEILDWASLHGAVIVTLDADFHAMLAISQAHGPSVIRLRIEGLRAREIMELVQHIVEQFKYELRKGVLVTVKSRKITTHRLPVGSGVD